MRFLCALSMMPEPLVQHAQAVHGVARGLLHRLADAMRHRIQPLIDRAGHVGLLAGERLPHLVDAAGGFRLRALHGAKTLLQLVGADRLRRRKVSATASRARQHHGNAQKQNEGQRAESC